MKKNIIFDKYELIPSLTKTDLKNNGFHYNFEYKFYTTEFNLYRNLFKLVINIDLNESWVGFQVIHTEHNMLYPAYYDREYGTNNIVKQIDRSVRRILKDLEKLNILQKKGTKRNE